MLGSASDVLRVWSQDGRLLHSGQPDGINFLWGIDWNSDGTRIATSSRYQDVFLWDESANLLKRVNFDEKLEAEIR